MRQSIEVTPFMRRFGAVRSSGLRVQVMCGLGWTVCVGGGALLALAAADYTWELPLRVRAAGLCTAIALTLLVAIAGSVLAVRRWSRPRTARDLERRFPQLGQHAHGRSVFRPCSRGSTARRCPARSGCGAGGRNRPACTTSGCARDHSPPAGGLCGVPRSDPGVIDPRRRAGWTGNGAWLSNAPC